MALSSFCLLFFFGDFCFEKNVFEECCFGFNCNGCVLEFSILLKEKSSDALEKFLGVPIDGRRHVA